MNAEFSIDRLYRAVAEKGNVCVGLDTLPEYVPEQSLRRIGGTGAVLQYNEAVVDATFDVCACYKIQIACYEAQGLAGLDVYSKTLGYIKKRGGISIADIKRSDIADTAAQYAKAHFSGDFEADIVTLNPYMGMDSIEPWLCESRKKKKGAFVLLRTSNKGYRDFEGQRTETGRYLYELVGDRLLEVISNETTNSPYGIFGLVVGAESKTGYEREQARVIRKKYGSLFFLIPGYGTQGGGAEEAALLLNSDKNGGVVNASRSILKSWCLSDDPKNAVIETAAESARNAVIAMRDAIFSAPAPVF